MCGCSDVVLLVFQRHDVQVQQVTVHLAIARRRVPPTVRQHPHTLRTLRELQQRPHLNTRTHKRLTALFPGLPGWAGTRTVTPMWILLKQETVSGSGISWAICMSASRSRQITMPAPHHLVFYRPDALPSTFKREQNCKETPYGTTCLTALFPGLLG